MWAASRRVRAPPVTPEEEGIATGDASRPWWRPASACRWIRAMPRWPSAPCMPALPSSTTCLVPRSRHGGSGASLRLRVCGHAHEGRARHHAGQPRLPGRGGRSARLPARCGRCLEAAGVDRSASASIRPGFGKTPKQTIELMRNLHEIVHLGYPVMVAVLRKRFVGEAYHVEELHDRDVASAPALSPASWGRASCALTMGDDGRRAEGLTAGGALGLGFVALVAEPGARRPRPKSPSAETSPGLPARLTPRSWTCRRP